MPAERVETRKIFSVRELTGNIKILLENSFANFWVSGEVSNVRKPSSGHVYFTLKDDFSQIRAVVFNSFNSCGHNIKDGAKVYCFGSVGVYQKSGEYQLYVRLIEPKGAGALQAAFEEIKNRLCKEGLFESRNKKPLPRLPKRLAIVTSKEAAVLKDMLAVLKKRAFDVVVTLFDVRVQGESAAKEILRAVRAIDDHYKEFDCAVIARGGGSIEDLAAFNDETLCRAVFDCRVPIVSAIGHETDWTICDFVADARSATPSAAIETVVPDREFLKAEVRQGLNLLSKSITGLVSQYEQRLDELNRDLADAFTHIWQSNKQKVEHLVDRLKALSPFNVLKRGYSVTFLKETERVITKADQVRAGSTLVTVLSGSSIESVVSKKGKNYGRGI